MRITLAGSILLLAFVATGCGGSTAASAPLPNPDGRTYFCEVCADDVAWPPEGHVHDRTAYCPDCEVRVPARGHDHEENRWCDRCEVAAVWVDDDEIDRWEARGHHHGLTSWCPVCEIDASSDGPEEPGGHHHRYTVFCPEEGCRVEVTRRQASDGSGPLDPAEPVEAHTHGKTIFCPICKTEVEKDPETDRPSANHFHFLTRWDPECQVEAGVVGHECGVTEFCNICLTEIPLSPGVPTGVPRSGEALVAGPETLPEPVKQAAMEEKQKQKEISAEIKGALAATEEKLGLEEQTLVHDHSYTYNRIDGTALPSDPVSRFRDYEIPDGDETLRERADAIIAETYRTMSLTPAELARHAVDRLESLPTLTPEQEKALEYWKGVEADQAAGDQ